MVFRALRFQSIPSASPHSDISLSVVRQCLWLTEHLHIPQASLSCSAPGIGKRSKGIGHPDSAPLTLCVCPLPLSFSLSFASFHSRSPPP